MSDVSTKAPSQKDGTVRTASSAASTPSVGKKSVEKVVELDKEIEELSMAVIEPLTERQSTWLAHADAYLYNGTVPVFFDGASSSDPSDPNRGLGQSVKKERTSRAMATASCRSPPLKVSSGRTRRLCRNRQRLAGSRT